MREPLEECANAGGGHFMEMPLHTSARGFHLLPMGPGSASLRSWSGVTAVDGAHEVFGALSKSFANP
jgi:hypothetical protein